MSKISPVYRSLLRKSGSRQALRFASIIGQSSNFYFARQAGKADNQKVVPTDRLRFVGTCLAAKASRARPSSNRHQLLLLRAQFFDFGLRQQLDGRPRASDQQFQLLDASTSASDLLLG